MLQATEVMAEVGKMAVHSLVKNTSYGLKI